MTSQTTLSPQKINCEYFRVEAIVFKVCAVIPVPPGSSTLEVQAELSAIVNEQARPLVERARRLQENG